MLTVCVIAVLTAESCCQVPDGFKPAVRVIIGAYTLEDGNSTMDAHAEAVPNVGGAPTFTEYTLNIRTPEASLLPTLWRECVIKLQNLPVLGHFAQYGEI